MISEKINAFKDHCLQMQLNTKINYKPSIYIKKISIISIFLICMNKLINFNCTMFLYFHSFKHLYEFI